MREVIIETDAMSRFDSAVDEVASADRTLSGFVLAYGQAGRGKSVAADRYHYQRGGAYVRVWQGWSQTAFLQRLLFEVRGKNMDMPRHTGNRCKELVVQLLEAEPKPIFIDEADRLRIDRIEDLRDIHEMTGPPLSSSGRKESSAFSMNAAVSGRVSPTRWSSARSVLRKSPCMPSRPPVWTSP